MSISKFSRVFAGALLVSAGVVDAVCSYLPARTGVGRSSSSPYDDKSGWCTTQLEVCSLICIKSGGKVNENSCTIESNTQACYECSCTFPGVSGVITPDLDPYEGTIPSKSCAQLSNNCWTAPGGGVMNSCEGKYNCGRRTLEGYFADPPVPIPGVPTNLALPVTRSTFADYNTWPAPTPTPEPAAVVKEPEQSAAPTPVAVEAESTTSSITVDFFTSTTSQIESSTSSTVVVSSSSSTITSQISSSSSLSSLNVTSATLTTITSSALSNATISDALERPTAPPTTTRRGPTGTPTPLPKSGAGNLQAEALLGSILALTGMIALL